MSETNVDALLSLMEQQRKERTLVPEHWKAKAKAATEAATATGQLELLFKAGPDIDKALALNVIARSGIFTIGKGSGTIAYERQVPCYINGVEVTLVAPELTQEHYNVLLTLTQCSAWASIAAGDTLVMSRYALVKKGLNWSLQGYSYKKLHNILTDLAKTRIVIRDKRKDPKTQIPLSGSAFGLLDYAWDETAGSDQLIRIKLDKGLAAQYKPSLMHLTSLAQRDELQGKSLALFLHSKFSSHSGDMQKHPVSIEKLYELAGSKSSLKKFKQNLKIALNELVKVEFLESWEFMSGDSFVAFTRKFVGQEAAYWSKMKRKGIPYAHEALEIALMDSADAVYIAEQRHQNLLEVAKDLKDKRFK